tara:strand:+ start:202 stop:618 length:417 start_codon:yes stop_codon:yes gene_type:complete
VVIDGVNLERFTRVKKLLSGKEERYTHQVMVKRKKRDPRKGTGKKPKGSGRRLYTDENPKDTVRIKFATVKDARATVRKVKRVRKSYARKIQILTVGEQRARVMGKKTVASVFKSGKASLRRANNAKKKRSKTKKSRR